MSSRLCYGIFGLFLLASTIASHLLATYASLFQHETAYLYNPETTEMFEIEMVHSVSSIHFWNFLNPFGGHRRRDPEIGNYLGRLSELRERIKQHNLNYDRYKFDPDASMSLISLKYFIVDGQQSRKYLVPNEWQGLIEQYNENNNIVLANAVIIKEYWPNGYLGNAGWPVEVTVVSNVVIFFGRSANEL